MIDHSHAAVCKEWGFLTTKGSPICNAPHITRLLDALSLPKEVAIIHCKGHQNAHDTVALGNNMADQVARQITLQQVSEPLLTLRSTLNPDYSSEEARALLAQEGAQRHPWEGYYSIINWCFLSARLRPYYPKSTIPSTSDQGLSFLSQPCLFSPTSQTDHICCSPLLPNMCFHLSSRRTPTPTGDSPAKGTYAQGRLADRLHPHAQTSNLPLSAGLGGHLFRMGRGLPHHLRDSSGSCRGLDDPSHSQIWVSKLSPV